MRRLIARKLPCRDDDDRAAFAVGFELRADPRISNSAPSSWPIWRSRFFLKRPNWRGPVLCHFVEALALEHDEAPELNSASVSMSDMPVPMLPEPCAARNSKAETGDALLFGPFQLPTAPAKWSGAEPLELTTVALLPKQPVRRTAKTASR